MAFVWLTAAQLKHLLYLSTITLIPTLSLGEHVITFPYPYSFLIPLPLVLPLPLALSLSPGQVRFSEISQMYEQQILLKLRFMVLPKTTLSLALEINPVPRS